MEACNGYVFPPFALIGKCLQKVRLEDSTVVLMAPDLADATVISAVIRNASEILATLTTEEDIVRGSHGTISPADCAHQCFKDYLTYRRNAVAKLVEIN